MQAMGLEGEEDENEGVDEMETTEAVRIEQVPKILVSADRGKKPSRK